MYFQDFTVYFQYSRSLPYQISIILLRKFSCVCMKYNVLYIYTCVGPVAKIQGILIVLNMFLIQSLLVYIKLCLV